LLSLRGENFRWADLVSGNLKEVGATPLATLVLWNTIVKLRERFARGTTSASVASVAGHSKSQKARLRRNYEQTHVGGSPSCTWSTMLGMRRSPKECEERPGETIEPRSVWD
jgi:hypothetical protein